MKSHIVHMTFRPDSYNERYVETCPRTCSSSQAETSVRISHGCDRSHSSNLRRASAKTALVSREKFSLPQNADIVLQRGSQSTSCRLCPTKEKTLMPQDQRYSKRDECSSDAVCAGKPLGHRAHQSTPFYSTSEDIQGEPRHTQRHLQPDPASQLKMRALFIWGWL